MANRSRHFRVGTRASLLARTQTGMVLEALRKLSPDQEIVEVLLETTGDQKQGTPRARQSDKRDWIAELEDAVVSGEIECAVHSGKDVPAVIHPETILVPLLSREAPGDILIVKDAAHRTLADLPPSSEIGTSSLRRAAQLLRLRPDCRVVEHRGNVPTRVNKLRESSSLAAIVLAEAGVRRLQLDVSYVPFSLQEFVPTVNQGILVAQLRADHRAAAELLQQIVDPQTKYVFEAERRAVETLQADCHAAVGIFAQIKSDQLTLDARVLTHDGQFVIEASFTGPVAERLQTADKVTTELLRRNAAEVLKTGERPAGFERS